MPDIFEEMTLKALRLVSNPITLGSGYPAAACFKNLNLVEIPDVMEKRGFKVAAALMRRWFVGQAFALPVAWKAGGNVATDQRIIPASQVDESL